MEAVVGTALDVRTGVNVGRTVGRGSMMLDVVERMGKGVADNWPTSGNDATDEAPAMTSARRAEAIAKVRRAMRINYPEPNHSLPPRPPKYSIGEGFSNPGPRRELLIKHDFRSHDGPL